MTITDPHFDGSLGPYESVLAEWVAFVTRLGHVEIVPNTLDLDDAGQPRLCYTKLDGEPLLSNSGGDPYRKMAILIETLKSARPS